MDIVRKYANFPDKMDIDEFLALYPSTFYILQPKYDGERVFLVANEEKTYVINRYGTVYNDLPMCFEGFKNVVIDGELISTNGNLYDLLRDRVNNRYSLLLMAFDILEYGDEDLRSLSFWDRMRYLNDVIKDKRFVRPTPSNNVKTKDDILRGFEHYVSLGYEGVVVKVPENYYSKWIKIKKKETIDLVIIGIRKTRSFLEYGVAESFLVADKTLKPVTYVSSGLSKQQKWELTELLLKDKVDEDRETIYVKPKIVLEVEYQEKMDNGLRHPRIKRIRWDKSINDVDSVG